MRSDRKLLTLLSVGLIAATASFIHAERLPLKTSTTADGLASNRISRIVRDSRGFLWFCTEQGLSRFDGFSFVNYTTAQGLPDYDVTDFLETREATTGSQPTKGCVGLIRRARQKHKTTTP